MIYLKKKPEIEKMRKAGKLAARLLNYITPFVKAGISTLEINHLCEEWTKKMGAISAPLNYKGFPRSICTSIDSVVCHGIPKKEDILRKGNIVNVDITLIYDGYHGDTSKAFLIEPVSKEARKLVEVTERALFKSIDSVKPGKRINVIGDTIADYVSPYGYGIVEELGGHGIGASFHEDPFVFHHRKKEKGVILQEGMTFTIEPMINQGDKEVYTDTHDNWTVYTMDGSLSAQFEHTILVTDQGAEILTIE